VAAQEAEQNRETIIKAAYLYNFAMYAEWPRTAAGGDPKNFYIGVLGKGDLNAPLKKLAASKTVKDKPIILYHFPSIKDYKPCHILFVAAEPAEDKKESAADRLAAALKQTKRKPVMIVTESEGLAQKGATVNFFIEENVVKFEINQDAVKEAGLQISPRVLQLGKIIPSPKK
jgi:hypothetical protein